MSGRSDRNRRGRRRGYGPTGFEEAGGYMAAKIAKLENQYKTSVSNSAEEANKGIFDGIAIFVNGYTEPTAEELKRIMMTNGGTYHHYFSRSKTTHIIASNLPDTKIKNMNTGKIVSPKWITESLQVGRLLDYTKYILYTNQSRSQPKIPFKPSSVSKEKSEPSNENSPTVSRSEGKSVVSDTVCHQEISTSSPMEESLKSDAPLSSKDKKLHDTSISSKDIKLHDITFNPKVTELHDTPLTTKDTSLHLEAQNMNVPERHSDDKAKTDRPYGSSGLLSVANQSPTKAHSMSTANPGFLSEFYNNSRLHHISTMGAMFKQYVNELQSKNDGFSGRKDLLEWVKNKHGGMSSIKASLPGDSERSKPHVSAIKKRGKRTVMHIDMDCFFVSVGLRKHPELRGKPIAVTHARGNPRSQVREGMDRQYELNYYKERAEKRLQAKRRPTSSARLTNTDPESKVFDEDDTDQVTESPGYIVVPNSNREFSTISLIDETSSMSEIASCSYEARKSGVKNGMFLGPALRLCPDLQTIPYDFDGYKEVSYKLYDIIASFTHDIEAVSCDEMFVDLTELLQTCQVSAEDFASFLRKKVQEATGCPCSAGMGSNMLVARMATRLAKPNGQHLANPDNLPHYMKDQKVTGLPGVGWSLGKRLEGEGIHTCGDLQTRSLGQLQAAFGTKTGQSLYNYCRGIDDRIVKSEHVRKSVSAEVNYGIRFTSRSDADKFISELAVEVEHRLTAVKLKGKCITLKLKVRAKDAPIETAKFMGHGVCDNVAKSVSLAIATSSASVIEREVLSLLHQVKVQPQDFRGVGIQVSRLEGHHGMSSGTGSSNGPSIKSFLLAAKSNANKNTINSKTSQLNDVDSAHSASQEDIVPSHSSSKKDNHMVVLSTASSKLHPERGKKSHPRASQVQLRSGIGQPLGILNEQVPSASQTSSFEKGSIDPEVLMALPEDIRDQVIAEYRQQGYIIPAFNNFICKDETVINDEPKPSTSGYVGSSKKPVNQECKASTSGSKVSGERGKGVSRISNIELDESNDMDDFKGMGETGRGVVKNIKQKFNRNKKGKSSDSIVSETTIDKTVDRERDSPDVSEDVENEDLITSFSQVDSSFLEAIPEDLREELRLDFERHKQATALLPPAHENLSKSPSKQQMQHGIEPLYSGVTTGGRGRWGRTDPQWAETEGLTTLTSIVSRPHLVKSGNSSTRRVISGAEKKKTKQTKPRIPGRGMNSSPSKRNASMRKSQTISGSKKDNEETPYVVLTSSVRNVEETQGEVDTEHVPHLCGVKKMSDVKSLIREWVLSCSHPEAEDAEILAYFYTSLISHHDLEKLDLLIKYLYRQVHGRQNKFWETAYQTVINRVQTAMLEHHQTKLKVLNL